MSSKKTLEQRVNEKEQRLNEMLEKAKAYQQQLKLLQEQKNAEERKARTHRLIEVGATVESVLGKPIMEEDLPKLKTWLQLQEEKGKYFSRALGKNTLEREKEEEILPLPENNSVT